jgi:hypothetical protein
VKNHDKLKGNKMTKKDTQAVEFIKALNVGDSFNIVSFNQSLKRPNTALYFPRFFRENIAPALIEKSILEETRIDRKKCYVVKNSCDDILNIINDYHELHKGTVKVKKVKSKNPTKSKKVKKEIVPEKEVLDFGLEVNPDSKLTKLGNNYGVVDNEGNTILEPEKSLVGLITNYEKLTKLGTIDSLFDDQ